jgi:predicted GNAT family acetyltransferase
MVVQHKQRENKGMFYVQVDGEILARLTYAQPDAQTMVAEHTDVDDELRGKNVGYQMVNAAVQYARNNRLKIVPHCPFVKAVFDKKPQYKDVLQETY